jgi:hypothetical protein
MQQTPPLPATLAQKCPAIDPVESDDWDDLAAAYMRLAAQYGECAARHNAIKQPVEMVGLNR